MDDATGAISASVIDDDEIPAAKRRVQPAIALENLRQRFCPIPRSKQYGEHRPIAAWVRLPGRALDDNAADLEIGDPGVRPALGDRQRASRAQPREKPTRRIV